MLWGTDLCYILRNRHFLYRDMTGVNRRWVDDVNASVKMLRFISEEFTERKGSPTLSQICRRLRMSSSKARVLLQELVDRGILVEVKGDDDVSYFPAVDFHRLSLSDIIIRLSDMDKNKGEAWKVRFIETVKREFSGDVFA